MASESVKVDIQAAESSSDAKVAVTASAPEDTNISEPEVAATPATVTAEAAPEAAIVEPTAKVADASAAPEATPAEATPAAATADAAPEATPADAAPEATPADAPPAATPADAAPEALAAATEQPLVRVSLVPEDNGEHVRVVLKTTEEPTLKSKLKPGRIVTASKKGVKTFVAAVKKLFHRHKLGDKQAMATAA